MSSLARKLWPVLATALVLPVFGCDRDFQEPTAVEPGEAAPATSDAELATASTTTNRWMWQANMPSDRFKPIVVTVNVNSQPFVYAIAGEGGKSSIGPSGVNTVQAFNPRTNSWTNRTPIPVPLRFHNGGAVIAGKIYVAGGDMNDFQTTASLLVYDPVPNTWTSKRSMPHTNSAGVSAAINGKLYVLTSCRNSEACESDLPPTLYRYDPVTDQWTTLHPPPSPHSFGVGAVINGKWYVVGGGRVGPGRLDVYDPATNTWSTKAPLNQSRSEAAGTVSGGKLYVFGGQLFDGISNVNVRTTSVYDPATNTWTERRQMPDPRTAIGAARVVVNGVPQINVIGGARPRNNFAYVP
jgi:N-acetylneuraminic acid mutarotase